MLALYTYELQHMILFIIRRDRNRINEIYIKNSIHKLSRSWML